ncbi:Cystathionine gamma-synthase, putative [Coccidioides posadasii C735 delta SOWgp]|uniref:cystathionine gamma-synthase n=1 Tax=Coccidioides posadasii (strain C735) TaxID=222929 RepID=C5PEF2_COCP7|nr:Cystathionine gamma-synthase, putative [Coccidioides posadasii C735 delta SOWgp]EER23110.1 Cystathionine gamma-synthase, putative [Coccidioides posadasii C735 delta SOWgp]|eukprot:XP_003065255.1 Cystathionine gamma-synthase, putative [Coccidioides posadasii C735 delta SOWgp]
MSQAVALGEPIPPNTSHAVSVSLPTWSANVGYEEGQDWVIKVMRTGYPRFFMHTNIRELVFHIIRQFGHPGESAMPFPSLKTASRCHDFMVSRLPLDTHAKIRVVSLMVMPLSASETSSDEQLSSVTAKLYCILYPKIYNHLAKQVWQHSGDGISSRRSEFCLKLLADGYVLEHNHSCKVPINMRKVNKGPKRYQRCDSGPNVAKETSFQVQGSASLETSHSEGCEFDQFIEERFGRNLSPLLANNAKLAVKRRIAGSLTANVELTEALKSSSTNGRIAGLSEQHVYLYPTGMSSIFNSHQALLMARGQLKSICFGFPYIDTLKVLEKWGPGVLFYGHGSSEDLDDLEQRLELGERYLALFTEFPGNPLLKSPDLERIQNLASKYDFAVVVDESVGNFINVNVLPYADIVVSSLTKIFSGDSNVMGGSAVYNPHGRYYQALRDILEREYEDNYWAEDAIFLERNSRDFVSRIERINASAEALTARLKASSLVKDLYYPKYSSTMPLYEKCRNPNGGYGGLFSVTFNSTDAAIAFFDALEVMKGPSLGTNFTLSSPYTLLAHYGELEWANSFGVASDLIRISVGLEDTHILESTIDRALDTLRRTQAAEF